MVSVIRKTPLATTTNPHNMPGMQKDIRINLFMAQKPPLVLVREIPMSSR